MPIYEYCCDLCAHEFEAIQKFSEDPLKICPACKQEALRKKISAAGFRLKGGGWYETDFKSGSDKKRNLGGDSGTAGASSESASSESTKSAAPSSESGSSSKTSGTDAGAASKSKSSDSSS
jgi:putative FmdB family regulatory protein